MTTNEIPPRPGTTVTILPDLADLAPRTGRVLQVENGGQDIWVDDGGTVRCYPPSWLKY